MWISECVAQNQKSRVHDSVVFIFWAPPRHNICCTKCPLWWWHNQLHPL
jgi:hypothetical protein